MAAPESSQGKDVSTKVNWIRHPMVGGDGSKQKRETTLGTSESKLQRKFRHLVANVSWGAYLCPPQEKCFRAKSEPNSNKITRKPWWFPNTQENNRDSNIINSFREATFQKFYVAEKKLKQQEIRQQRQGFLILETEGHPPRSWTEAE